MMLNFDRYTQLTATAVSTNRGNDRRSALHVRSLMTAALAQESFRVACVDRILSSIENLGIRWRNPPLYDSIQDGFSIRVFYWPAGHHVEPHVHNAWTVTGVLHNEITVETFGVTAAERGALEPVGKFAAQAGKTGYLLPPCAHRLTNESQADSATLHVFAAEPPHEGTRVEFERRQAPAGPVKYSYAAQRALRVLCAMLAPLKDFPVATLFERVYRAGDAAVKLQVVRAVVRHDIDMACQLSRQLETQLAGRDREALARINDALLSARPSVGTRPLCSA